MPNDNFRAADVAWQEDAECNGAPFDFTPDVESPKGLDLARGQWCNPCPVRTECLAYALLYHLVGYWGGTDTGERRLLAYRRDRVHCPVCQSKALIRTPEGHEICQRCGTSWLGSSRPRPPGEATG